MKHELSKILESMPSKVQWKDIVDFDNFDERLSAVSVLFVNTIGVCENYIQFCPDNEPPLKEEELSWVWSYRPDLSNELLEMDLSDDFKVLIESYRDSEMDRFWKLMT